MQITEPGDMTVNSVYLMALTKAVYILVGALEYPRLWSPRR